MRPVNPSPAPPGSWTSPAFILSSSHPFSLPDAKMVGNVERGVCWALEIIRGGENRMEHVVEPHGRASNATWSKLIVMTTFSLSLSPSLPFSLSARSWEARSRGEGASFSKLPKAATAVSKLPRQPGRQTPTFGPWLHRGGLLPQPWLHGPVSSFHGNSGPPRGQPWMSPASSGPRILPGFSTDRPGCPWPSRPPISSRPASLPVGAREQRSRSCRPLARRPRLVLGGPRLPPLPSPSSQSRGATNDPIKLAGFALAGLLLAGPVLIGPGSSSAAPAFRLPAFRGPPLFC